MSHTLDSLAALIEDGVQRILLRLDNLQQQGPAVGFPIQTRKKESFKCFLPLEEEEEKALRWLRVNVGGESAGYPRPLPPISRVDEVSG